MVYSGFECLNHPIISTRSNTGEAAEAIEAVFTTIDTLKAAVSATEALEVATKMLTVYLTRFNCS